MRLVRTIFLLLVVASVALLSGCEAATSQTLPDQELVRQKVAGYLGELFPHLGNLEVGQVEKQASMPFFRGVASFVNQGRQGRTEFFVTGDAQYLIMGQVWDMEVDAMRARWNQLNQGSEERLAKIDFTDRPSKGNESASVVIVEYSDYQCPYCSRAYTGLEKQLMEKYGDRVKFVFKHLPLEQLHPWAMKASVAAACVYVQNPKKFWGLHDQLFMNQKQITVENIDEKLAGFAAELELNVPGFQTCVEQQSTKSVVDTDMREARSMGLSSTPSFLINGAIVAGAIPFEQMSAYIDYALEEAESKK